MSLLAAESDDARGLIVGKRLHQRRQTEKLQITGECRRGAVTTGSEGFAGRGQILKRTGGDFPDVVIRKFLNNFSKQFLDNFRTRAGKGLDQAEWRRLQRRKSSAENFFRQIFANGVDDHVHRLFIER